MAKLSSKKLSATKRREKPVSVAEQKPRAKPSKKQSKARQSHVALQVGPPMLRVLRFRRGIRNAPASTEGCYELNPLSKLEFESSLRLQLSLSEPRQGK